MSWKNFKHFFAHDFEQWEEYRWQGYQILKWGKLAGEKFPLTELRQKRKCKVCGFVQVEIISES